MFLNMGGLYQKKLAPPRGGMDGGLRTLERRLYSSMPPPAGKTKWTPQRIVQIFRWCAVVVTLAGVLWLANTALFLLRAQTTDATLVDWDVVVSKGRNSSSRTSETHSFWHAIVELQDESGSVHRARSPRGFGKKRLAGGTWEMGSKVPVYYDPKDPTSIFIRHSQDIWFPPSIITILGVLGLLVTSAILLLLRARAQKNADEVAAIVAKHIAKKK